MNEVICHGIPDFRELCDGDIVNIDVSVFKEGVGDFFHAHKESSTKHKFLMCGYKLSIGAR